MKFCKNCNNNCIITKLDLTQQNQMTTPTELSDTSSDISSEATKSSDEQYKIKKQKDVNNTNNKNTQSTVFFKCTICDYLEEILDGALIISKTNLNLTSDYRNKNNDIEMINDKTLPHTRNYVCPNKSCNSHDDHSVRDAVWFKPSQNNYAIKMICISCKTIW